MVKTCPKKQRNVKMMLSISYRCDTVRTAFLKSDSFKISDDLGNMHNLAAVSASWNFTF